MYMHRYMYMYSHSDDGPASVRYAIVHYPFSITVSITLWFITIMFANTSCISIISSGSIIVGILRGLLLGAPSLHTCHNLTPL